MSEKEQSRQWGVSGGIYRPVGTTAPKIEAGVYQFQSEMGLILRPIDVVTDELIDLPDPTCTQVLAGIEKFWTMESRYREHGLLYKRSVGLWGPPGGGKTATVILLGRRLVAQDGLVILFNGYADDGLALLRKIEPTRRVICIMEELDDLLDSWEDEILSLLDGETQVDGVVYVATTNHFDKLPSTISNRPSRFDEWIYVGMPSPECRRVYLEKVAGGLDEKQVQRWVKDTEGFSVAHLKELAAAVLCLDHSYDAVLKRLRTMIDAEKKE